MHWAGGMRLLLGTASVGFPSGQCARCKHRRNELLTAHMVSNTLKIKDRLLFSVGKHFLHKDWVQIPLMKRHWAIRLTELWIPWWPGAPSVCQVGRGSKDAAVHLRWHEFVFELDSWYHCSLKANARGAWALCCNGNKNLKLNPVCSSWKVTWKRELLLLFMEFCCC